MESSPGKERTCFGKDAVPTRNCQRSRESYFKGGKKGEQLNFSILSKIKNFAHLRVTLNHVALKLIMCFLIQMGKKASKITFIGIHSRRTDYLAYRKTQIEDIEDLLEDYYQDAMEHYRLLFL